MKKNLFRTILVAAALAVPFTSPATTFFTDNFTNGSTTNQTSIPGGTPTASYTSYDIASTKNATFSRTNNGSLTLSLNAGTTSGFVEAQAIFATGTNVVNLNVEGDYIDMIVVFTNTANLLVGGPQSYIWLGLFNSAGAPPVAGALANAGLTTTAGSTYAAGNCANWWGYAAQIASNGTTRVVIRAAQTGTGTTSANQELLANNVGGGAFNNPVGASVLNGPTTPVSLTIGAQYTAMLRITLSGPNTLSISNALFSGVGTGGTILISQLSTNVPATNSAVLSYDGMAIGIMNKGVSLNPIMDITSITLSGQSSPVPPPTINSNPVPVLVSSGGSCAFFVDVTGSGVQYQWYRNGTALSNGGNISGVNNSILVISPASPSDAFSTANGYYVQISDLVGHITNSTTNSLTIGTARDLVWSGAGTIWDVDATSNWLDGATSAAFTYGDSVVFNDSGSANRDFIVNGPYVAANSVTVTGSADWSISGSGSIAGPGTFMYSSSAQLTLNNINTFTGGLTISNATAWLLVNNYAGLGNGPVNLALAGGTMEVVPTGGQTTGINGTVNVLDDFTIQFDGNGAYSGVFLGNLSGIAGKTLTLKPKNDGSTNRFRVYGANTVYNANLALNGTSTSQANYYGTCLSPYNASGSQTYVGVISGNGGLVQRANGLTVLSNANTYAGGTTPTTGTIGFGNDNAIGTGPLFVAPEVPNATGSGQVLAWGGSRTIANAIQYPSATNNQTLIIGGNNALTFSGPITLNGLDSASVTNVYKIRTFQVTNTALTTFSGVISDNTNGVSAAFGLSKTGNGVLVLNNTETYTGPTAVSGGVLQVNGSLNAGSTVTADTNGTLGGTGVINGAVTVNPNGTLAPGASIGTLTINNNLTLNGNMRVEVDKSLSPAQSNDMVSVSGTLSAGSGGILTVTNLNPASPLAVGNKFTLFNKAVSGGASVIVTGAGVTWNNNLATDGSISVASTSVPMPVLGVPTVSNGTNLVFAGSDAPLGINYVMLYQTNVAVPVANWIPVTTTNPFMSSTFSLTLTNAFRTSNPARYYILSMP